MNSIQINSIAVTKLGKWIISNLVRKTKGCTWNAKQKSIHEKPRMITKQILEKESALALENNEKLYWIDMWLITSVTEGDILYTVS